MGVKAKAEMLLLGSRRMKNPTEEGKKEMSHVLLWAFGHHRSAGGSCLLRQCQREIWILRWHYEPSGSRWIWPVGIFPAGL